MSTHRATYASTTSPQNWSGKKYVIREGRMEGRKDGRMDRLSYLTAVPGDSHPQDIPELSIF